MKNRNFIRLISLALILCLSLIALSSCADVNESTKAAYKGDPFISIDGEEENGLVYHRESKTVYVLFEEWEIATDTGYGYLSLYVVNGHFCEYIDGEIVEIIPEVTITSKESSNNDEIKLTADEIWANLTEEEKQDLLSGK